MKRLHPLPFFSICAVFDFVWGSIKWHSVTAGLVAIVGGLPLTAVLYFLFGALRSSNDDSDVPRM
jgi:ABC-type Co2+ transport system permease subunit